MLQLCCNFVEIHIELIIKTNQIRDVLHMCETLKGLSLMLDNMLMPGVSILADLIE